MVKVTERALNQTQVRLFSTSRAIEREIFQLLFGEGSERDIVSEVRKYQNTDGGFGNGYEPDFRLYASTPMATSKGLGHLHQFNNSPIAQIAINKAIHYLEDTYDKERGGWLAVTKEVNAYDHAPWWTVDEDTGRSAIDEHWGNPTIELAGYLFAYKEYLRGFDLEGLMDRVMEYILKKESFPSFYEVFCMLRFYSLVDDSYQEAIAGKLCEAVDQVLEKDPAKWHTTHCCKPLDFVLKGKNPCQVDEKLIGQQLDLEAAMINEEFAIEPNWGTEIYVEGMEQALDEWRAILTLESLTHLKERDRLE